MRSKFFLIGSIFLISFPSWCYQLTRDFTNGFYWATLPVRFVVAEENPERKSLLESLAQFAIQEWEKKTDLSLWDLSQESTVNIIRWSTNFSAETKMDPVTVLAIAVRYTNGPYFAKSEIIINGTHPAFNTSSTNINKMNIATTLTHELGHTMGLDHSENVLAIMAPSLQYPYIGLHSDDILGMKEVFDQTEHRQITSYISPLAYTPEKRSSQALSCATVSTGGQSLGQGMASFIVGTILSFLKILLKTLSSSPISLPWKKLKSKVLYFFLR